MQRVVEFAVVFACRNEAEAVDGLECDDADHKGCGKVPSSSVGDDERLRHFGVPVLWLESIPLDGRSKVRCSAPTSSHGPADGLLAAGPCEGSAPKVACGGKGQLAPPLGSQVTWPGLWPLPWAPRPRLRRVRLSTRGPRPRPPEGPGCSGAAPRRRHEKCAAKSLWVSIKGRSRALAHRARPSWGRADEREIRGGFRRRLPLVVALRQESGQLGFDLPALVFREETTRQLGAQFVDMIDLEHFFVSVLMTLTGRVRARTGSRIATRPAEPAKGGADFVATCGKMGGALRPRGGPRSRILGRH